MPDLLCQPRSEKQGGRDNESGAGSPGQWPMAIATRADGNWNRGMAIATKANGQLGNYRKSQTMADGNCNRGQWQWQPRSMKARTCINRGRSQKGTGNRGVAARAHGPSRWKYSCSARFSQKRHLADFIDSIHSHSRHRMQPRSFFLPKYALRNQVCFLQNQHSLEAPERREIAQKRNILAPPPHPRGREPRLLQHAARL